MAENLENYDASVLDSLVKRYTSNQSFRKFIDQLDNRQREPRNRRTVVYLMPSGLSDDECIKILKMLAEQGFGNFEKGRPKSASRLIWSDDVSVLDLARTIKKEASSGTSDRNGENQTFEVFQFPVAPGETWPVEIPMRFTRKQLENFADLIKVIARSRD